MGPAKKKWSGEEKTSVATKIKKRNVGVVSQLINCKIHQASTSLSAEIDRLHTNYHSISMVFAFAAYLRNIPCEFCTLALMS